MNNREILKNKYGETTQVSPFHMFTNRKTDRIQMIKELVEAIKETAEKIKGVKFFSYEGQDLIDSQNNNPTIQIFVEDDVYTQYLVSKDLVKVTVNIDILDKCNQSENPLDIHDNTEKVGIVLIKLIQETFPSQVSIYDFSLMSLSRHTDDSLYGQRLTIYLIMPSPINECNINDYLDELNSYEEKKNKEITIEQPKIDLSTITINPIKVNKNKFTRKCK